MASIFSKIISGEIPCYKVAEDQDHFAFLDINPIAPGHTLVVPKKEVDYIFDLSPEEYSALQLFTRKVAKGIKNEITCRRIGVAIMGLEVPHAHIHLIPINTESDMNFFKDKCSLSKEEMEAIAEKISQNLSLTRSEIY